MVLLQRNSLVSLTPHSNHTSFYGDDDSTVPLVFGIEIQLLSILWPWGGTRQLYTLTFLVINDPNDCIDILRPYANTPPTIAHHIYDNKTNKSISTNIDQSIYIYNIECVEAATAVCLFTINFVKRQGFVRSFTSTATSLCLRFFFTTTTWIFRDKSRVRNGGM